MYIKAYFSDFNTLKTGLTPTIDGWVVGGAQVITAQTMTEQAGGWYYYDFTTYDTNIDYVFNCDAGIAITGRYTQGSNDDDLEMSGQLLRLLGLTQENQYMDSFVFDGNNMIGARIRIFPSAALAGAATRGGVNEGEIEVYTITATYMFSSEKLDTFRMVRE